MKTTTQLSLREITRQSGYPRGLFGFNIDGGNFYNPSINLA